MDLWSVDGIAGTLRMRPRPAMVVRGTRGYAQCRSSAQTCGLRPQRLYLAALASARLHLRRRAGLLAQRELTIATIAPTSGSLRTGQSSEEILNGTEQQEDPQGSSAVLRTKARPRLGGPLSTVHGR